jgi:predicted HTH transcriptional regulator
MGVDVVLAAGGELPPEGKTLEYKRDLSAADTVLRAVIAFANSAGGQLVIGVDDGGGIVGVPDPEVAELKLANLIADSVRPQLVPTIELVSSRDKTVLVVNVPCGSNRPYYLKSAGRYQGTMVRLGSSNRQATALLVDDLARSSGPRTFDRAIAGEATMDDLDLGALSAMLGREIGEGELLTLELAKREDGQLKPTNAGLLVACPTPQQFFPHAWVQCARFRGPDRLEMADQASIYGPLPLVVDQVMVFLQRHRFLRAEFGKGDPNWDWRRKNIPSIPELAIRELVINALVHSAYSYGGSAIKVAFWDEAITIENPGGLVPGVTIDQITRGVSVLRNPAVARIFREMGLIESWGSGLRKVIRDLDEQGFGSPDFEELHERLRVTVHIPNHDPRHFMPAGRQVNHQVGDENQQASGQVSKSSEQVKGESHQVGHQVDDDSRGAGEQVSAQVSKLSEQVRDLLLAAATGPKSRAQLLAALGLADAYGSYRRHIVPLVDQGLLERTVPDRPNARTQRYALSESGSRLLAALRREDV